MISIEKQLLFLLSHVPQIETHELISIYMARSYSPQHIRNTLSKMKKAGYITSPTRSTYSITDIGLVCLNSVNHKPIKHRAEWANTWYIVMLEIPETNRKMRDLFRSDLIRLGFGMLYNSVYISPWDYAQEVSDLATNYQIHDNITIVRGNFLVNPISPKEAEKLWQLDKIIHLYNEKMSWFNQEFLPSVQSLPGSASPLDIFVHYLYLGEQLSELFIADPILPLPLLPEDWPGETVRDEMGKMIHYLSSKIPNESYYSQFVR